MHVNMRGTVGVAVVGSDASNVVGGICETYMLKYNDNRFGAINTALITTQSPSGAVSAWTELVAAAHELGMSETRA